MVSVVPPRGRDAVTAVSLDLQVCVQINLQLQLRHLADALNPDQTINNGQTSNKRNAQAEVYIILETKTLAKTQ